MVYQSEATAVAVVKQHVRPFALAEGRTFMVADIGAGTLDITSHQVRCSSPFGCQITEMVTTSAIPIVVYRLRHQELPCEGWLLLGVTLVQRWPDHPLYAAGVHHCMLQSVHLYAENHSRHK